jgi:high-affinity nickel-transport protein
LVDGLDGYFAASTLRLAAFGEARAKSASRVLTVIVVIFAFSLGGAELIGVELEGIALPLGLSLFIVVIGIRIWARSSGQGPRKVITLPRSAEWAIELLFDHKAQAYAGVKQIRGNELRK